MGGSSGIGLAVANLACENGAQVVIASRNAQEQLDMLESALGRGIEAYSFDITSGDDVDGLFETTGLFDHLVITVRPPIKSAPFPEMDLAEAKQAFESKLWGPCRLIQVAQRYLRQHGSIILTSGIAGEKIYKGASTMATLNSAIETLGRALAVELAPLRVNVVSPGFVAPKAEEVRENARRFPVKRLAFADEVAMAYLHLMVNPYITGTITVVDGGARLI